MNATDRTEDVERTKVFGIGLNKTGTKTLGHYLQRWGYRHRTYDSDSTTRSPSFDYYKQGRIDELVEIMNDFDSCEDWPWPLLYRELDARFPDARFVLTVRRSPDVWYRSLCNMAVRLGPFPLYEKTVYGYGMPQGRKHAHIERYEAHNAEVEAYFAERPGKLLRVCWEDGDGARELAEFLGLADVDTAPLHANRSPSKVYSGDSLMLAHAHRLRYQYLTGPRSFGRRVADAVRRRLPIG